MRRIKFAIILCFSTAVGFAYFYQPASVVRGQQGGTELAAPTGVNATDSLHATKVGLRWNAVRGATRYRIFRNTANNSGSATDVGNTPADFFFDPTAVAGQQYFYWVRSENSQTVSAMSVVDQGRRAIGNESPGAPFVPLEAPLAPSANPITAVKGYLGKTLFWDEQLSSTKTVSCGTCHRPGAGGSDPRSAAGTRHPGFDNTFGTPDDIFGSPGVPQNNADGTYSTAPLFGSRIQVTSRRAPTYLNTGYTADVLFWDGRALSEFRDPISNTLVLSSIAALESQAVDPPVSTVEMGHVGRNWTHAAARVTASKPLALARNIPPALDAWIDGRTYPELFEEAFGTPEVTPSRIAMALATHQRSLFSDQTPLDRAVANIEPLTPLEEQGRAIFAGNNANCAFCHGGALLSNGTFNNVGVRPQIEDRGRGAITGIPNDDARFKTPTLRNLELRAPYMHNGRLSTIEDVVEFYSRGGDFDAPNIDRLRIRLLNLSTQQKQALAAFLKRPLTDPRVRNELPPFDRPQLYTESNRVPIISGTGRAGTAGEVPVPIALEPPIVGNPSFTVAVENGLGGATAVVVIDSADPEIGTAIPASGVFARQVATLGGMGAGSVNLSIPNNPALIGRTFFGRWYIEDPGAANGFSVSTLFRFTIFGDGVTGGRAPFDFDGDSKTDISIFRPGAGEWWINRSSNGTTFAAHFGAGTDRIVPADYTGDGKSDVAVWRPSTGEWFVLRSEDFSYYSAAFGAGGDLPAPADYDADGRADIAVFRPATATWFVSRSSGGTTIEQFGANGDRPAAGDYDGDGRTDLAIFRPSAGQWWIKRSTAGVIAFTFGTSADKIVQGDYTGDAKTDAVFWRPSTGEWFVLRSEDFSYYSAPFGTAGDIPAPGDYDGDGRYDTTVFRPSAATWFSNTATAGTLIRQFGQTGDTPVPNAFVP